MRERYCVGNIHLQPIADRNQGKYTLADDNLFLEEIMRFIVYLFLCCTLLLQGWINHCLAAENDYVQDSRGAIRFDCSAQVARAFGWDVLKEIRDSTGIRIFLHVTASPVALKRLKNGFSDIITSTRRLSHQEKRQGYVEIPFCRDPLAVVAHPSCGIDAITEEQLRKLFTKEIRNWRELQCADIPVTLFVPGENTGAYKNFVEIVMKDYAPLYDFTTYESTMILEGVRNVTGAVSFTGKGAVDDMERIQVLRFNGYFIDDPEYPFFQTFRFVTQGEPEGLAKDLINFALSERGLSIIREKGMYPVLE